MEFRRNQAIYLQIADQVCENILSGKWKEKDRLPSIRELSISIEVNPNTVMRSYSYLQDMDIVYNQRGIGHFVTDRAREKTMELKKKNFINRELPLIFKAMDLLDLTFDDLKELYVADKKKKKKEK